MINLQTERLRFRQWQHADHPAFAAYFGNTLNTRFLGGVKDSESAYRLLASYIGHHSLHGYSYVAVEEKNTGILVGAVGLWNSPDWPEHELGYWLLPTAQGKGYGAEAGAAARDYAKKQGKFPSLVSYISADNESSIRLAERLGARYDSTIQLLDFGPHEVYRYW